MKNVKKGKRKKKEFWIFIKKVKTLFAFPAKHKSKHEETQLRPPNN